MTIKKKKSPEMSYIYLLFSQYYGRFTNIEKKFQNKTYQEVSKRGIF
jgi:hypothetical protein